MKKKRYLNSQQQLEKLLKEKNIKLNVAHKSALKFVKRWNYVKILIPFKDLLVDYNFDNTQPIMSKNSRILKEYQSGLRVPITLDENVNKHTISKYLKDYKTQKHKYTKPTNFTKLMEFNEIDRDVSSKVFEEFQTIEPTIKTVLSDFIGNHSANLKFKWFDWLLNIVNNEKRENLIDVLNKIYDELNKNKSKDKTKYADKDPNRYKNIELDIWYVIDKLTLGQLQYLINFILYSKIPNKSKRKLCRNLFGEMLERDIDNNDITYGFFSSHMYRLVNLRNSLMHFNLITDYLFNERITKLQRESKLQNVKFWFVKNTFGDKSIKTFLDNYDTLGNSDEHNISKDFILNKLQLGYYIEVEDLDVGRIWSLDLDILENIDWWFKREK